MGKRRADMETEYVKSDARLPSTWVTKAERAEVDEAAAALGLHIGAFVRKAVLTMARETK